jgi:hypothetical protein
MKSSITLRLDDEQAETLIDTLTIGACARYAPNLQTASLKVAKYVEKRVDDAKIARGRAHCRKATK